MKYESTRVIPVVIHYQVFSETIPEFFLQNFE